MCTRDHQRSRDRWHAITLQSSHDPVNRLSVAVGSLHVAERVVVFHESTQYHALGMKSGSLEGDIWHIENIWHFLRKA